MGADLLQRTLLLNAQTYEIAKGQTDLSFNLTEYFIKFTPGTKYYVYAVGINDNTGSKQAFAKLEGFTLPEPTKPAPEVTVTGIDAPEGQRVALRSLVQYQMYYG